MVQPLDFIDIPKVYSQHAVLIDFLLYLVLFNGIAQVAFAKRLEGKGGRLVAGAVGTALALAMTGLEATAGFTLASFGAVAATFLLLLVGVMVYRTLRHLGAGAGTAGALALVLVGLGIQAAAPRLSDILSATFPFLSLAVAVGLLFLAWKALRHLVPQGSSGKLGELAARIGKAGPRQKPRPEVAGNIRGEAEAEHLRDELRLERPEIGRHLKRITKQERKACKQVSKELSLIRSLLEKGRHEERDRKAIAEALQRIPPERHELRERVDAVKLLDQRLGRFDLGVLSELRSAWDRAPAGERTLLRRLALEERGKVQSEQRIAAVESYVATYDSESEGLLERAATAILNNAIPDAIMVLQSAERIEAEAQKRIEEILDVERELRRIMRLELRQAKRAA
jgi:hypothetical protein